MLNTEPMFSNNESAARQFGAAFAVTGFGALIFSIVLVSAGATFVAAELGVEKFGWVFLGCAASISIAVIITRIVLRKFFVTVLLPDKNGYAGRSYVNFLICVRGGIVKAVSSCTIWGNEGMLCLTIPLAEGGIHGFPTVSLNNAPITIPIKYLNFATDENAAPVKWQDLYDFAAVNGNVASISDGLRKRFADESKGYRSDWAVPIARFIDDSLTKEQLIKQIGQDMTKWNLCPFASIEFAIGAPIMKNKHSVVLT